MLSPLCWIDQVTDSCARSGCFASHSKKTRAASAWVLTHWPSSRAASAWLLSHVSIACSPTGSALAAWGAAAGGDAGAAAGAGVAAAVGGEAAGGVAGGDRPGGGGGWEQASKVRDIRVGAKDVNIIVYIHNSSLATQRGL